MNNLIKIKSALISVYHKDNLKEIIWELNRLGVDIFSTGGTKSFIEGLDIKVQAVEDITSYPSILGGRVKTLHPKIFGGILSRRDNRKDNQQLAISCIFFAKTIVFDFECLTNIFANARSLYCFSDGDCFVTSFISCFCSALKSLS